MVSPASSGTMARGGAGRQSQGPRRSRCRRRARGSADPAASHSRNSRPAQPVSGSGQGGGHAAGFPRRLRRSPRTGGVRGDWLGRSADGTGAVRRRDRGGLRQAGHAHQRRARPPGSGTTCGLALEEARAHGIGNSKVDFAAVEIASDARPRHLAGLEHGPQRRRGHRVPARPAARRGGATPPHAVRPPLEWSATSTRRVGLWNDAGFLRLVAAEGLPPRQDQLGGHRPLRRAASGATASATWGSGCGRTRRTPVERAARALGPPRQQLPRQGAGGAGLAQIKVHQRVGGRTVEKTLPARLAELGLASATPRPQRDRLEPVRDRARAGARHARRLAGGRARRGPPSPSASSPTARPTS